MGECNCTCVMCDIGQHCKGRDGDCTWHVFEEPTRTVSAEEEIDVEAWAWTEWQPFPDPRRRGILVAPFGAGVYWLRDSRDGECIYIGEGGNVAKRMSSLLPSPYGCGTRNNAGLRECVITDIEHTEYRTLACSSKQDAQRLESFLRSRYRCRF